MYPQSVRQADAKKVLPYEVFEPSKPSCESLYSEYLCIQCVLQSSKANAVVLKNAGERGYLEAPQNESPSLENSRGTWQLGRDAAAAW